MTELERIQAAIRHLHHVESKHVESVQVKDAITGQIVWDGTVEVFDLEGHNLTNRLYAWVRTLEDGRTQLITVLHLHPVESAQDAVRAFILREHTLFREQESDPVIFQVTRLGQSSAEKPSRLPEN